MLHIILYQPEIPPNTGNIIRLCANTGATLHLIKPYGFVLDDKNMKRAQLDYSLDKIHQYENLANLFANNSFNQLYVMTTKANNLYTEYEFAENDAFIFGPESRGLPLNQFPDYPMAKLPMQPNSRSLNLSNSVAITLYEAWRQLSFNEM